MTNFDSWNDNLIKHLQSKLSNDDDKTDPGGWSTQVIDDLHAKITCKMGIGVNTFVPQYLFTNVSNYTLEVFDDLSVKQLDGSKTKCIRGSDIFELSDKIYNQTGHRFAVCLSSKTVLYYMSVSDSNKRGYLTVEWPLGYKDSTYERFRGECVKHSVQIGYIDAPSP